LLSLGVELEYVTAYGQHRLAPRLVGQYRGIAVDYTEVDARRLELLEQTPGRLGERRQIEIKGKPLDESVELALVVERHRRRRAADDESGEGDVLRLRGEVRERATGGDHRDRLVRASLDADVVMDDEVRSGIVAQGPNLNGRERRVRSERAVEERRHGDRIE
jgi:hypothetical protein